MHLHKSVISNKEVFIHLKANLQKKAYTESLPVSSAGAQTITVSLSGNIEQSLGITTISRGDLKVNHRNLQ